MKYKSIVWILLLVLALSFGLVMAVSAQGSLAKLIVINYVGQEMTFSVDGQSYTIAGTDVVPEGGRLELELAAGRHDFSADIPGGPGLNAQVDIAAGETLVLGARIEKTAASIDADGIVLEAPKDALVLFDASLTPAPPPATPLTPDLRALAEEEGALVLDNHIGEELHVDIGGTIYTVAPSGRLQINFLPGEVVFVARVGSAHYNGSAVIEAGEYTGLSFTQEIPGNLEYEEGEPAPAPESLKILVSSVTLVPGPVVVKSSTALTSTVAVTSSTAISGTTAMGSDQASLTVVNYAAQILTLNIDYTEYQIPDNGGELTLVLDEGEYTFTASTAWASSNGDVVLDGGDSLQLSIVTNADEDKIVVYYID